MDEEYFIEMLWRCSSCKHENLGRHKECVNCGSPLEDDEEFYMPGDPSEAARVTDSEQLKHAAAGPDWTCKYCDSQQRKLNGDCAICGAPQDDKKELEELRADFEEDKPVKEEPKREKFTSWYDEPKEEKKAKPKPKRKARANSLPKKSRRKWKFIAAAAGGAVLVGLILFLIFRTKELDVTVDAVSWLHTVKVDRYQVYAGSGFDEDMPSGAFEIRENGHRHHHYKQVQDGTRTEHYTVRESCGTKTEHYTVREQCGQNCTRTCRSQKNGYSRCTKSCTPKYCSRQKTRQVTKYCNRQKTRQVPKYKQVSVTEMHYSWKVWKWGHNRNVISSGTSIKTFWPSDEKISLNKDCRGKEKERSSKSAEYKVVFKDEDGEKHTYEPHSNNEFKKYPIGSKHRIRVSVARGVEIVREK